VANLFERLQEKQSQPPKQEQTDAPEIVRRGPQPIIPLAHRRSSPSEQLLAWLLNYWAKPTVTLRDISAYGPNCVRDPMDVMSLTKILVEYGWLIPVRAWRRDMKKWRVVRQPSKQIEL
jgi:hypothetical protein